MDMVHTNFLKSILGMRKVGEVQFQISCSSLIYDARNGLVKRAIEGNFDRILWLDSDMDFDPDLMERLSADMDEGREYVSALFFKRKAPIKPCIYSELAYMRNPDNGNLTPSIKAHRERNTMRKKKMPEENYILAYYQKLTDGSIAAGRWIWKIYEYLVKGLSEKQFFFDQKKASAAINWIETHCFHVEGPLAPSALNLELWQKAMISAIFGIVDKDGNRQFREILLVVARKNGKSLLAASIGAYLWRSEGGYGESEFRLIFGRNYV